jgi:hypothetical protein
MDKLVDIFCDVDDFCRAFIPLWGKHQLADCSRKRQKYTRMTTSEIMTIIIYFHTPQYRNFKNYYLGYISRFYKDELSLLISIIFPTAHFD